MDIFSYLDFHTEEETNPPHNFFNYSHKAFLAKLNMTEEEYEKLCAPYLEEASAFADIIKAEKGRKQELENILTANAVREEKGRGGESIHRGYYCPSLIEDIVVGNCKRGSLCKENNPKATYTHYFDCDNKHIATRQQDGDIVSTEYILYSANKSLGVLFDGCDQLVTIAECEYDKSGRILKYILVLCDTTKDAVIEYHKELYNYSEENIIVETSNLLCTISPAILTLNKYVFKIEAGFLKNYTVEVFDSKDISSEPLNSRFYNVKIKRKIPVQS